MRRIMLMLAALMLLAAPAWTQQSNGDESEWPICFDEQSWTELESQIQEELRATALDASAAAVKPHLEYEAKLEATIEEQTDWLTFWKVTTGIGVGMAALFAVLWLVSCNLGPVP